MNFSNLLRCGLHVIIITFIGLFLTFQSLNAQPSIQIHFEGLQGDTLTIGIVKNNKSEVFQTISKPPSQNYFLFKSKKLIGEQVLFIKAGADRREWQFMYKDSDSDFKIFVDPLKKPFIWFENHKENEEFYVNLHEIIQISNECADSNAFLIVSDSLKWTNHQRALFTKLDTAFTRIKARPNAGYYFTNQLLQFFSSSIQGFDKAYIYLVDNILLKFNFSFSVDEKNKFQAQANDYKILLERNQMPDFTLNDQKGQSISLGHLKAKHLILLFWSPTCPQCKKAIPSLVDFAEKYKNADVKILTVCDKGGDQVATCWPIVQDFKMHNLINGVDPNRLYNQKLRMRKVPKPFLLDKKKKYFLKILILVK